MELDNRKRQVDRWLDAAIKQYDAVEPRADLEQEILRGLRTAQGRPRIGWLVFAAAMVALLIVGVLISTRYNGVQRGPIGKTVEPAIDGRNVASISKTSVHPSAASGIRRRKPRQNATEANAQSWPVQFPTPHPLSEQERLLAQYVRERPNEARLVARARAELLQRDLLDFEKQTHKNSSSLE